MNAFHWLAVFIGAVGISFGIIFKHFYMRIEQGEEPSIQPAQPVMQQEQPTTPQAIDPDSVTYPWDTPAHCYHNTGVLCDKGGMSLEEKNVLSACIYQESNFLNYLPNGTPTKHLNYAEDGKTLLSTDWGICQVNDGPRNAHICPTGCDFPSVEYVMDNPGNVVAWMVKMALAGKLGLWDSYSSGAYKKWLTTGSPMWALAEG